MLLLRQILKRMNRGVVYFLFITAVFYFGNFLFSNFSQADLIDELENQINQKQEQWQNLEEQKKIYLESIKEKQEEITSLKKELSLLDLKISELETSIAASVIQIEKLQLEIESLILSIEEKKKQIIQQKELLGELLRTLYEYDKTSHFEIFLTQNKLSDFLNQSSYLETITGKIKEILDGLKDLQKRLEEQKRTFEEKKLKLEEEKLALEIKKNGLEMEKDAKATLLAKTRGEETRYRLLLADVTKQREMILGDIEQLKKEKAEELARIQALQSRPKGNEGALQWYFSQTDPRWGDSFIGLSDSTLAHYGCAVASLAMVFKYHEINTDPLQLARQPIFYYDLIVWPGQWKFLDLVVNTYHKGVNWERIDKEISQGHPVIVFVKAVGKGAGHYVVIFDKDEKGYIVNDPMWGANIYLSSTRQNISTLYDTTTEVDQMIIYH